MSTSGRRRILGLDQAALDGDAPCARANREHLPTLRSDDEPLLEGLDGHVFGRAQFRNEIVWCYTGPSVAKRWFPRKHDTIYWYSKGSEWVFNADAVRMPYSEKTQANFKGGLVGSGYGASGYDLPKQGKVPETWWPTFLSCWAQSKGEHGLPDPEAPCATEPDHRSIEQSRRCGDGPVLRQRYRTGGGAVFRASVDRHRQQPRRCTPVTVAPCGLAAVSRDDPREVARALAYMDRLSGVC